MNSTISITLDGYNALFEQAQKEHAFLNEPIPEMSSESKNKIKYILDVPFQRVFGKLLYWGFYKKASVLFYLMIKNHPLSNGNKRMACYSLIFFYQINNRAFNLSEKKLYDLTYYTVNSDSTKYKETINEIAKFLKNN